MVGSDDRQNLFLGPVEEPYSGGALLHNLLLFGKVCRTLGMESGPDRMIEAARALKWVDLTSKSDFFYSLRSLIVTRATDLAPFEEAFRHFWRRHSDGWSPLDLRSVGERGRRRRTRYLPAQNSPGGGSDGARETAPLPLSIYSPDEILRHKAFGEMTPEELVASRLLVARLARSVGQRRTRRFEIGSGRDLELRGALRKNLKHGGELLALPRRTPKKKPRPIVLLCDISGSMEAYSRILLHFAHSLSVSLNHVESFVFGTRLTRITRSIRIRSIDKALQNVGWTVRDWSGGTQTGRCLREFNFRWSRRVLGKGAMALIITDGWDRGDLDLLGVELARLKRSCQRLMWLNPLMGAPRYAPLTGGARILLEHVDDCLSVRDLNSLTRLGAELSRIDWRASRGERGRSPRFPRKRLEHLKLSQRGQDA